MTRIAKWHFVNIIFHVLFCARTQLFIPDKYFLRKSWLMMTAVFFVFFSLHFRAVYRLSTVDVIAFVVTWAIDIEVVRVHNTSLKLQTKPNQWQCVFFCFLARSLAYSLSQSSHDCCHQFCTPYQSMYSQSTA